MKTYNPKENVNPNTFTRSFLCLNTTNANYWTNVTKSIMHTHGDVHWALKTLPECAKRLTTCKIIILYFGNETNTQKQQITCYSHWNLSRTINTYLAITGNSKPIVLKGHHLQLCCDDEDDEMMYKIYKITLLFTKSHQELDILI